MNTQQGARSARSVGAPRLGWACAALISVLGGCTSFLDNASAYDSELFLCAPEHADHWESELASCRSEHERDGSCGGIVSFKGVLQGQPLSVDSRLDSAAFYDLSPADGSAIRNEVKLGGVSPYFRFRFRLWEIGSGVSGGEEPALQVLAGRSPDPDPQPFLDDFVRVALRLSASGQSRESSAGSGTVSVTLQTETEQAASIHLEIAEDAIDGCFHAFATERNLSASGSP